MVRDDVSADKAYCISNIENIIILYVLSLFVISFSLSAIYKFRLQSQLRKGMASAKSHSESSCKTKENVENMYDKSGLCKTTIAKFIQNIGKDAYNNRRGVCEYKSWEAGEILCPYCQKNHDYSDSFGDYDDFCWRDNFGDESICGDNASTASGESDECQSNRRIVALDNEEDEKDDYLTQDRTRKEEEKKENAKTKKEKKRLKKQRQKERKKKEREEQQKEEGIKLKEGNGGKATQETQSLYATSMCSNDSNNNKKKHTTNGMNEKIRCNLTREPKPCVRDKSSSDDDAEDEILLSAAFVQKAVGKSGLKEWNLPTAVEEEKHSDIKSKQLQASALAEKAVVFASKQQYTDAICLYTHAIAMFPDARLYGNRAFCYEKIQNFQKALQDSDKCVRLDPEYIKGHYRRAKSLIALQMFSEARNALEAVLKLDSSMVDVKEELTEITHQQLMAMGFTKPQIIKSLKDHCTFDAALDALCNEKYVNVTEEDLSSSEEEDSDGTESDTEEQQLFAVPGGRQGVGEPATAPAATHNATTTATQKCLETPVNKIWVGNVTRVVSERALMVLFGKYGKILHVKLMPEKFCAFITYASTQSAVLAKESLQFHRIGGNDLIIRYRNDTASTLGNKGKSGNTEMTTKVTTGNMKQVQQNQQQAQIKSDPKMSNVSLKYKATANVPPKANLQYEADATATGQYKEAMKVPPKATGQYKSAARVQPKATGQYETAARVQPKATEAAVKVPPKATGQYKSAARVQPKATRQCEAAVKVPPKATEQFEATAMGLPNATGKYKATTSVLIPVAEYQVSTIAAPSTRVKKTGPVNGNECYFWRTTGCQFGRNCRNAHLPSSKGVDFKPNLAQRPK